jgi:hypothetical protein
LSSCTLSPASISQGIHYALYFVELYESEKLCRSFQLLLKLANQSNATTSTGKALLR